MLGSRHKGEPHDCGRLSESWSPCMSQLWEAEQRHTPSSTLWCSARHTLQAGQAGEPRRSWARPLTLCLLRMKREDFITSCKTTPPPLQSPSSQALSLPPSLLHYLPASLPHSQPVARSRACPSQERGEQSARENLPNPPPARAVQCTERNRDRETRGRRWTVKEVAYGTWFKSTNSSFSWSFVKFTTSEWTLLPVKDEEHVRRKCEISETGNEDGKQKEEN